MTMIKKIAILIFWTINAIALSTVTALLFGLIRQLNTEHMVGIEILSFLMVVSGIYWTFRCIQEGYEPAYNITKEETCKKNKCQ
jgi:hypothetical protein